MEMFIKMNSAHKLVFLKRIENNCYFYKKKEKMKKLILLIAFVLATSTYGQYFELTSHGFKSDQDKTKDFVVLDFPEKKQSELYMEVLDVLNKKYVSANNVLSKVESQSITINARGKNIRRTSSHSFENDYTIVLAFKDGKMKIAAPVVNLTSYAAGHPQEMHLTYGGLSLDGSHFGIYKKSGKVKYKKAVEDLNQFANEFVLAVLDDLKENDTW